jgi:hypothetical protein
LTFINTCTKNDDVVSLFTFNLTSLYIILCCHYLFKSEFNNSKFYGIKRTKITLFYETMHFIPSLFSVFCCFFFVFFIGEWVLSLSFKIRILAFYMVRNVRDIFVNFTPQLFSVCFFFCFFFLNWVCSMI